MSELTPQAQDKIDAEKVLPCRDFLSGRCVRPWCRFRHSKLDKSLDIINVPDLPFGQVGIHGYPEGLFGFTEQESEYARKMWLKKKGGLQLQAQRPNDVSSGLQEPSSSRQQQICTFSAPLQVHPEIQVAVEPCKDQMATTAPSTSAKEEFRSKMIQVGEDLKKEKMKRLKSVDHFFSMIIGPKTQQESESDNKSDCSTSSKNSGGNSAEVEGTVKPLEDEPTREDKPSSM